MGVHRARSRGSYEARKAKKRNKGQCQTIGLCIMIAWWLNEAQSQTLQFRDTHARSNLGAIYSTLTAVEKKSFPGATIPRGSRRIAPTSDGRYGNRVEAPPLDFATLPGRKSTKCELPEQMYVASSTPSPKAPTASAVSHLQTRQQRKGGAEQNGKKETRPKDTKHWSNFPFKAKQSRKKRRNGAYRIRQVAVPCYRSDSFLCFAAPISPLASPDSIRARHLFIFFICS